MNKRRDRKLWVAVISVLVGLALALPLGAPARADDERRLGHQKTAWERPEFARHKQAAMRFGDEYRAFLGRYKTEREVVGAFTAMAKKRGFKNLLADKRPTLRAGSKVYASKHGKILALVVVGEQPVSEGVHVVASHIDAVRVDLKQKPLYADGNAAWLETQYYGGIKSYQWLSQPLELRGVVVKKNGAIVNIAIGDDPSEPVLVIPDVATHVSYRVDQQEGEQLPGEKLDPILSSTPLVNSGTTGGARRGDRRAGDRFAAEAERLLAEIYGVSLDDLVAAELELVPAVAPRDVGIDRALIGGYGHDDRACSYAAVRALLEAGKPRHTAIVMLVDREEVGSHGNTGAQSNFARQIVAELIEATGGTSTSVAVDRALSASMVFSGDVIGGVNAQYPEIYDARNAAFLGAGVVWDRTAIHGEVMAYVRTLFDQEGITHQPAMWTKVSNYFVGGTVLPYFTRHGMSGLDVSIPLLSMHAPFEVISKADLYEAYRGYRAFLRD